MAELVVELNDINVRHEENLVLEHVNLQIQKGEFVYLLGRVGSGKSSLMKTLYADVPLRDGLGTVAGFQLKKIRKRDIANLRRKVGVVFQDFQLLGDRTVFMNLDFVLRATGWKKKSEREHRIKEVLEKVNMLEKDYKMPYALSGGEQQRIAIARALLNDPQLILADEPTGNLDPETTVKLMELLKGIQQDGTAVVMITHNTSITKEFPARSLLCDGGQLKEMESDSIQSFIS